MLCPANMVTNYPTVADNHPLADMLLLTLCIDSFRSEIFLCVFFIMTSFHLLFCFYYFRRRRSSVKSARYQKKHYYYKKK